MDTDHRDKLYREGKLTDTQYRRAGGVCGADEIDDEEYQEDATAETGLPGTTDFGPDDAGHIDASANRRGDPEGKQGSRPDAERQGSHHRRGEGRVGQRVEPVLVQGHQRAEPKLNPLKLTRRN